MKCTVRWAGKNAGMSFIGDDDFHVFRFLS
jgi:hypothetical protein